MRPRALGYGALGLLLAAYIVQLASPLRLTVDSVDYLQIARSLATGHGIPQHAPFPPGLPGLYALLDVVGLGTSWAFVALNCMFVAIAIACTLFLYRQVFGLGVRERVGLGCVVLLSYVLIKHAAIALSEVPFLGVSTAVLAALTAGVRDRSPRRWAWLALGTALGGAALTIRSAGLALFPAALAALVTIASHGKPLRPWLRTRAAALTAATAAAACAGVGLIAVGSRYFGDASSSYRRAHAGRIASLFVDHLRNWGEIVANIPETRLPDTLDFTLVPLGVVAVLVLATGLWRLGRPLEPVNVFTVSYLVLIFLWPYENARFWLPLVPLAAAYGYVALRPLARRRAAAAVLGLYLAVFCALGLAAFAYDTRLSYSGSRFPDRYGTDSGGLTLQPTYRVAFGVSRSGDAPRVDRRALKLLRHYEPRARP